MSDPVTAVKGVATVGSALIGKRAAKKAAEAQAKAATAGQEYERQKYEEEIARQEPFRQAAVQATNRLAQLYGAGGAYTMGPTREQLLADPLYAAGLDESIKALERSAAARGGLLSGGTIRGVRSETLQGLQNAYGRALAQRELETNALARLAERSGAVLSPPRGSGGYDGSAMAGYEIAKGNLMQDLLGQGLNWLGARSVKPKTIPGPSYGGSAVPWRSPQRLPGVGP
jgi:hypothetical protein